MASTQRNSGWIHWLFLAPAMIVLGVFTLGAAAQVFYYSFTKFTAFDGPHFVGVDNYQRLLLTDRFWRCLLNSATYLLVTPAVITLSLAAALLVEADLRGMRWLRLALFIPVVTPTIVASLAWRLLLNEDHGMFNEVLSSLGLPTIHWLTQHPWTLVSAALVTLWKGFGFYMLVFLGALLAVPSELREAACIDGAGRWRTFCTVTLPGIRPAIVMVFIVSSISALKVFDELYITARGVPITNQTVVPLLYQVAFEEGDYGTASAIGVALFLVVLGFSLVNFRLSRRRKEAA